MTLNKMMFNREQNKKTVTFYKYIQKSFPSKSRF